MTFASYLFRLWRSTTGRYSMAATLGSDLTATFRVPYLLALLKLAYCRADKPMHMHVCLFAVHGFLVGSTKARIRPS